MFKLAVVGSREYPNLQEVRKCLDTMREHVLCLMIITGGAKGVDKTAEEWALGYGVPCKVIRPVDPTDKFSYLLRNVEIITQADMIVIFYDGKSKGSKFVIDYCGKRGLFNQIITHKEIPNE